MAAGAALQLLLLLLLVVQLGWHRRRDSSSSPGLPLTAAHAQQVAIRVAVTIASARCTIWQARPLMPRVLPLLHLHQQGLKGMG
jgi:hypothetical protein